MFTVAFSFNKSIDSGFPTTIDLPKTTMFAPVPGGVGAVTTSILATNIVKACKLQNKK